MLCGLYGVEARKLLVSWQGGWALSNQSRDECFSWFESQIRLYNEKTFLFPGQFSEQFSVDVQDFKQWGKYPTSNSQQSKIKLAP